MQKRILIGLMLLGGSCTAGCATWLKTQVLDPTGGRVTVNSGGVIDLENAPVQLLPEASGSTVQSVATTSATITYVAHVPPMLVAGKAVQADTTLIRGNQAFIGYNTQNGFGGGIQVLDITKPAQPRIEKSIGFTDIDVNALYLDGDTLLFAGEANPDTWGFHACVGEYKLAAGNAGQIFASVHQLKSYAATAIDRHGNDYYVGVGAQGGGIEVLDLSLQETAFIPDPDIRDIDDSGDDVVALAGTTDSTATTGRLIELKDAKTENEIPIANFGSDYAKASIRILERGTANDTLAFLGLSTAGLVVRDLDASGSAVFELANPDADPKHVTNSASTDGKLIFLANGEYGFRVVQILDLEKTGSAFGQVVGYHPMIGAMYGGQNYSANYVAFKGNSLFVASGVGGVNVYEVDQPGSDPTRG